MILKTKSINEIWERLLKNKLCIMLKMSCTEKKEIQDIYKRRKSPYLFLINSFAHVFILMNKFTPSVD